MSEPLSPTRHEIVAALARIGITGADDAFVVRCIELNAMTARTLAMIPLVQDKGLEPSHVFSPPMRIQK